MTVQAVDCRAVGTSEGRGDAELESLIRETAAHNVRLRAIRDLLHERKRLEEECTALGVSAGRASDLIIAEVALKHGIRPADIKGADRGRWAAWPRQEAMWRLRDVRLSDGSRRWSLPQIGQMLGGKKHTTVLHALRAYAYRNGLEYVP